MLVCPLPSSPRTANTKRAWPRPSNSGKTDSPEAANLFERNNALAGAGQLAAAFLCGSGKSSQFLGKDEEKLTAQLKKAQDFLNDAKALQTTPKSHLAGTLHTAWIVFDGAKYGMTLSPIINQLYDEAYKLEPGNPRVAFGRVEWKLGTARFFGQDTKPFCEELKQAVALFDTYETKGAFYPNGGGDYARQSLAQNCKEE
ncbi:MAG: hypothetical protein R2773_00590 [Flavobacteriaceae bacterium]